MTLLCMDITRNRLLPNVYQLMDLSDYTFRISNAGIKCPVPCSVEHVYEWFAKLTFSIFKIFVELLQFSAKFGETYFTDY